MSLFRRNPPNVLDCTEQSYAYWLRAQRPPFEWFLGLDPVTQAGLARIGDDYVAQCIEDGSAVAQEAVDEETQIRRVAAGMVGDILGGQGAPRTRTIVHEPSMAGVGSRRVQGNLDRQGDKDGGRCFMGRKPDAVEEV